VEICYILAGQFAQPFFVQIDLSQQTFAKSCPNFIRVEFAILYEKIFKNAVH
jgi:hypothetical protein